ncbi:putative Ig domain-containing protein [Afipia clevelandensis]|uniref:Dystroglycan-type cadherin-like domain-containing protein n=1 Tax=Afipia clevelandensis ATCC 49720 TaxID=883079 RepID=K8PTH1_9BRAD|nr:putative Ig domain-containing protein [Afipia clevelandensis]EKS42840.1 hypothetical protein HMPREF9696_00383 [Afipia clevelandensis ATCC 49720]
MTSVSAQAVNADSFVFADSSAPDVSGADAVAIVSPELLFSGHYARNGLDLVLSSQEEVLVVPGYFKGETRGVLMSPEGATISGRIVEAMTARVQYAQADQIAGAVPAVGNVAKISGMAVVTRNGVPVELKQGDRLLKGDVVQTGAETTLGISFVDGTALGLASNARIVLDEMTYDPNGSSNSSLMSLIQGTITLVAGHTAKYGNMRVETPVATMGIRGTAIMVEIAADNGPSKFSVLREPDGKIGAFHLYDKETGDLLKIVSQAGLVTVVTPLGVGQPVSAVDQLKTLAEVQAEKGLIQQVFQIFYPNYHPDAGGGDRTGSSVNPLANPARGFAALGSDSGVPALMALAAGATLAPAAAAAPETIFYPQETPVVRAVAVANVVDVQASQGPVARNFAISDQVTVTLDGQVIGESAGRYVPGTGALRGVESTVPAPQGVNLASLVHVDPATGVVTYDASQFAFLGVGEAAIYTIGFESQPGSSAIPETLTLTINGLNDSPTVEHAIPDQRAKEGCRFEYVIPACVFADLDANDTLTYRAVLANGDPLPNWLTFDPATMMFSGTPPKGEECVIHIKIIATDEHNATAVDQFDLVIADSHPHHHHHHDHWFDDDGHGFAFSLDDQETTTVTDSHVTEKANVIVAEDHDRHWDARKTEVSDCGDSCSRDRDVSGDDRWSSSKTGRSSSGEHVVVSNKTYDSGSSDVRTTSSVHVSASPEFDSGRSSATDVQMLPRDLVDYSSQTSTSHHSHGFFAKGGMSFSWSHSFEHQHDGSGAENFTFRLDIGNALVNQSHSHSFDLTPVEKPWSGSTVDVAALVHAMTAFDAHDGQGTTRVSSSVEIHTHQSDFHLI